jgi:hypothetical protein
MAKITTIRTFILLSSFLALTGCTSQNAQQSIQNQTRLDAVEQRVAALEAEKNTPVAAAPAVAPPAVQPTITEAVPPDGFTDIHGVFGEKEITALNKLHVFDSSSGKFDPQKPITRGEFVKWLVVGANSFYRHPVRVAEAGPSAFPDVTEQSPYFKYIQALVNAGFVVGYDDKSFRPDDVLTREQMIGIKTPFDFGRDTHDKVYTLADLQWCWKFNDDNQISPRYRSAFYWDGSNSTFAPQNTSRVWQTTKLIHPQMPVTRAEAAVCISKIGSFSLGVDSAISSAI